MFFQLTKPVYVLIGTRIKEGEKNTAVYNL